MKLRHAILLVLGLCVGHFIYQAMAAHRWDVAVERSFFQAAAIYLAWLFFGESSV